MTMMRAILYLPVLLMLIPTLTGCMPGAFLIEPVAKPQRHKERIIEPGGFWVHKKIAIIDVDGVMTNGSGVGLFGGRSNPVSDFVAKLRLAEKDSSVKAVVLRINSPGGTVSASDLMHHELLKFKEKTHKPVIAAMLGMAASGGYYLAVGCDEIYAQPSTITGSIGVIMKTLSYADTMKKLGLKSETIKSGELKDMMSPTRSLTEKEREILNRMITDSYERFLAVILEGRDNLDEATLRPIADGRIYTAQQALDLGLIDRIAYLSEAIERAKELAGLKKAKVVMYGPSYLKQGNLYSSNDSGTPSMLSVLPSFLKPSTGTHFYYLWEGVH